MENEENAKPVKLNPKREAFLRLKNIIQNSRPMDIEDYDKELAEYREEKYGKAGGYEYVGKGVKPR